MCACETGVRVWALASEPNAAAICRIGSLLPAVTPCIRGHCAAYVGFYLCHCDWSIGCICRE